MGRVTIFAINGCPFCVKAKEALKSRGIPYLEINLSTHPDKRSDLLNLSSSLTVPQIFFNETHVGGSEELLSLLKQWDSEVESHGSPLERYKKDIEAMSDPTDPRLQPSTKDPVKESIAPPRGEEDVLQIPRTEDSVTVLEMVKRLLQTVPFSDLTYRLKTYKKSIKGHSFLNFIMKEFNLTKEESLQFGLYLSEKKLVTHVTGNHVFEDRDDLFYRLQPHQTPSILNSYRIWTDRVDPNSLAVLSRISKKLQKVFDRATDTDGNVNLSSALLDLEYPTFEEEACELQGISMDEMDLNTKTAFVINLYNMLIKYAQVKLGVPESNFSRASFFTGVNINIGGEIFSFHDLENGILRGNAKPPYSLSKVFSPDDKRIRLVVDKVDPRIHFGLNCGARSCPPVKKFTTTDLDEELRIVALAFCEQDITVDESSKSMLCSTIFKWYLPDFAPSISELPKALMKFLYPKGEKFKLLEKMIEQGPIKVKFREYDWGSNVVETKVFDKSNLKADQYLLKTYFGCQS